MSVTTVTMASHSMSPPQMRSMTSTTTATSVKDALDDVDNDSDELHVVDTHR
jgi:hypothetical protein